VSSSLIRQDLVPMVVGYVLIMGALAIGLRIVRRSGRAADAGPAAVGAESTGAKGAVGSRPPAGARATGSEPIARGATAPAPAPESPVTPKSRLLAAVAREPGWRRLAVFSLGTAVGGYLLLMVVIIAYYVGIGVPHSAGTFVPSAFSGCAMLIGLAAPVFAALSWLAARKGWRI
jgi:hypothetical protein